MKRKENQFDESCSQCGRKDINILNQCMTCGHSVTDEENEFSEEEQVIKALAEQSKQEAYDEMNYN